MLAAPDLPGAQLRQPELQLESHEEGSSHEPSHELSQLEVEKGPSQSESHSSSHDKLSLRTKGRGGEAFGEESAGKKIVAR